MIDAAVYALHELAFFIGYLLMLIVACIAGLAILSTALDWLWDRQGIDPYAWPKPPRKRK